MVDPFAEVVTLLQPSAPLSKLVSGAGVWNVHRANPGTPFYCVLLRVSPLSEGRRCSSQYLMNRSSLRPERGSIPSSA